MTGGGVRSVDLGAEAETGRGWRYPAGVVWADGSRTAHEVTLSWVDHDRLSGGSTSPSRVAEAVLAVAAARLGAGVLPRRLDASIARRLVPMFDAAVQSRLPGAGA